MRDFTLTLYKKLLTELIHAGYRFVTFIELIQELENKEMVIILRHDVDKKPLRSSIMAKMENELQIKGTYYFRVIDNKLSGDEIEGIAKLGHEIGYHYDDLNIAGGDVGTALDSFQKNLSKLRELAPVKTACMHGSPLSRYDNRDLWKNNDYHEFGIIGEPYFDIDFNNVMYLTDTGRRWDGWKVSMRDRVGGVVSSQKSVVSSKIKETTNILKLHSTMDIINALNKDLLPNKIMITIHPQRWTDNYFYWIKELIWQKLKNIIKYLKIKRMEKYQEK